MFRVPETNQVKQLQIAYTHVTRRLYFEPRINDLGLHFALKPDTSKNKKNYVLLHRDGLNPINDTYHLNKCANKEIMNILQLW